MRYLHEEGVQTSLSYASEMIQNIANNEIRNATKIITLTPGFLGDSFEPAVTSKSPSDPTVFIVTAKAGPAFFPSGEMFCGNGFICKVPLTKSDSMQYLKLSYQELKRSKQTMAWGSQEHYAEILDGAKVVLSMDPALGENDLMIARINYPSQAKKPIIEDVRDMWKFYWTGAQTIDPESTPSASLLGSYLTHSIINSSANVCRPNVMNNQYSLIRQLSVNKGGGMYSLDIVVEPRDDIEYKDMRRLMPPHPETGPESLGNTLDITTPPGLKTSISLRKTDAYRTMITSNWRTIDVPHELSIDSDLQLETIVHQSLPLVGVRVYSEVDLPMGSFAQIWLSDAELSDINKTPPTLEIPIPIQPPGGGTIFTHPFYMFFAQEGTETVHVRHRIVDPNMIVTSTKSSSISMAQEGDLDTNLSMIMIPIGQDRTAEPDPEGRRFYFNNRIKFYVPRGVQRSGESEKNQRLMTIEFFNFVPSELSDFLIRIPGPSPIYDFDAVDDGALLRVFVTDKTHNTAPEIDSNPVAGDFVHVLNSPNHEILPNGRYEVDSVGIDPGDDKKSYWLTPLYPGDWSGGPISGVHLWTEIIPARASVALYDVTEENEIHVHDFGVGFAPGQDPPNGLAGYTGYYPTRNIAYPESPYYSEWGTILSPGESRPLLLEGHWYELRLTKTDGTNFYFDAFGFFKIWLRGE